MVMKQSAMRRNLRQSIVKSFGRYAAIVAIIALGAGLFVGLLMTKADMVETGQVFMDEQNMFDLRMVSNYGWTEEYVEKFSQLAGVSDAEGLVYMDFIARLGESGEDSVYRFYSMPVNMNQIALRGGRLPSAQNECLADGFFYNDSIIGQTITVSDSNDEDSLESLKERTFTVVGYVATPLYMDMNRGTTSVGSGSLENYFYIPAEAFDVDYYSEINLTVDTEFRIYTDAYNDFIDKFIDSIEPDADILSEARFQDVKAEAEVKYDEGYQEYLDGKKEFEEGKAEAEKELADALKKLQDGEKELADSRQQLIDGERQIEEGREQLELARKELSNGKKELAEKKAQVEALFALTEATLDKQYPAIKAAYDAASAEIGKVVAEAEKIASEIQVEQVEANIKNYGQQLVQKTGELESSKADLLAERTAENPDAEKIASLERKVAALEADVNAISQNLQKEIETYSRYEIAVAAIEAEKQLQKPAIDAMELLKKGYEEYQNLKETTMAELAAAEKQIQDGYLQLWDGERELDDAYDQLMIGWGLYNEGKEELAEGWEEYEKGKKEAEQEIADAEKELKDAEEELAEAREEINDMDEPDLIILDRGSNIGYNNLDSSSNIVQGVSRVFPVFFLLVASLVCITTMTRMIDEERTQIGTLKALGYSNAEIISKYMIYSGSGAVLGCGLGLLIGCTIFPQIIWQAYCIMLYITPGVKLTVNWGLCITVTLVYTAVLLFVTWYCCRRTLQEEPAELIRPKAPDAGKKILLEYLPVWQKISFLNKVTIRNIFRYRQRLAMMLVGIGGCTALLVTGFGLRDSIVNVVDYQFEDVTLYDLEVYFRDELTARDKEKFEKKLNGRAEQYMFYHQSSVELEFDDRLKEIYMISADDQLQQFIDLHYGDAKLTLPEQNEVVLSVGVAEALGITLGDAVVMRNADMQTLELTVSAIYENHVYNYSIVNPKTIESQWGTAPELQMAFVKVQEGQDLHAIAADITDLNSVMNVGISEDTANMVKSMMDALDLVVIVIVFCAGLLAVIVLYNLTNININERIREIATIKVLGFNASETAAYVFKENLTLTVVGSVFGLFLGKLLLLFVMDQIKIDMVWFKAMVEPISYVWSIALTILSAIAVDFIFYFKLEKINMAEALKSVE